VLFDEKGREGHSAAMILLIDNYDSFTFNIVHHLGALGVTCDVRRNDALSVEEALALDPLAALALPKPAARQSGTVPVRDGA